MDHIENNTHYEKFRLLLKHSHSEDETMEKILIQWLKDKATQPNHKYCEKLVNLMLEQNPFEKIQKLMDFYNLLYQNSTPQLQNPKNLPLTKHLKNLLSVDNSQEKIIATYKLMDHIENNTHYEKFRLLLKHSHSEDETMEKILIQWLKDKATQPNHKYCEKLVNLMLEQNPFEKIQKLMDFYNLLYQNSTPQLQNPKNLPLTKHLKNLLSVDNSQEKIIATYKLMDHIENNTHYEKFRLLLKHSHSEDETMEKILIQWLKDKATQPNHKYCEKLVNLMLEQNPFEKIQKLMDFYNLLYQNSTPQLQNPKNLPLTKHLKNLLSVDNSQEKIIATYKLMDHIENNTHYEKFRLLLKHSHSEDETMEKILIQWLKDKATQPNHKYCEKLVNLMLEQNPFEKIQKLMDFYNLLYQNSTPQLQNPKNLPLTKHLKNLLSVDNSQEKIIATYKLMDHIENNTHYEKFRLLLKHSHSEDETMEKILIQWLKDKATQPNHKYCEKLVNLMLEQNPFEKIQKLMDFYNLLYQNSMLKQLKKAYKHFIFERSPFQFMNFIHQVTGKSLFNQIKVVLTEYKDFPIQESFSKGQVLSKLWARDCLIKLNLNSCKTGLILCGWSGVLSNILLEKPFQRIVSVDKNPDCEPIAIRLNYENHTHGRFNSVTKDIFDLNYNQLGLTVNKFSEKTNDFDIIINTSCEHIQNFNQWYDLLPEGQLVLLQSNDFFDVREHVNCVNSLETFKTMAPMNQLLFEGELPLENYNRFMLIGYK